MLLALVLSLVVHFVPLTIVDRIPYVNVALGTHHAPHFLMTLDTGSSSTYIPQDVIDVLIHSGDIGMRMDPDGGPLIARVILADGSERFYPVYTLRTGLFIGSCFIRGPIEIIAASADEQTLGMNVLARLPHWHLDGNSMEFTCPPAQR